MNRTEPDPSSETKWLSHLVTLGARVEGHRVYDFGDPIEELAAATNGTVICDLSHFGLIGATGIDTESFLQGQLSSDLRELSTTRAQFSSYNTPKGRVLANLLLFRNAATTFLQLGHELAAPIRKRLTMFVLRAKVALTDASDQWVHVGVAGRGGENLIRTCLHVAPPATALEVASTDAATVIRLPGDRFEIVAAPETAFDLWRRLLSQAHPVGAPVWDWLDLRAGIPWITAATQDQFVPQMLNLDLIGGVSFQKGCYPGQEIVARTQYLGRLKRRMYLARLASGKVPTPGESLYSDDLQDQASGMVVNAARAPGAGSELLAVVHISSTTLPLHLGSREGPMLTLQPLPYPLPPSS